MTELRLAEGSRAAELLACLDPDFASFVAELPPSLRTLAGRANTFTGAGGDALFAGPSAMNPGVTCSPWLFWELVQPLDDTRFRALALGGALVVLASVLLDHLVDGQAAHPAETALLHQALHEAGTARLQRCLPADSSFWNDFARLGAEHVAGLAAEREAQLQPWRLTRQTFLGLVPAKFAPIVVTMAAFLHALGRPHLLPPVEASIKQLAVGSQLLDDLGDWQEDVRDRHLTLFLAWLAPAESWAGPTWLPPKELQARIDADWHDLACLELAAEWLDRSLAAVEGLPCPAWNEYVAGYRALAAEHLQRAKARYLLRALAGVVP